MKNKNKALKLIEQFDTVIIHRHSKPDGDAIGSQVGLAEIIRTNFPTKRVLIVGDDAGRYSFMNKWQPDVVQDSDYTKALAIVLDTSAKALISDARYQTAAATLRFDHHIFCEQICDVEVIDPSYESCCGLIADFALKNRLRINELAAKSLFTGMVTDSGRFRYDSTTSKTFQTASQLMKHNIDTTELYANLYADDFDKIKMRAEYTLKIKFTNKNTAYIITTKEELASSGANEFTVSRGMVGVMGDIKGVNNWVNFTETDHGVLCELRSKCNNINPIAVKYGGGGHAKASGATVPDLKTAMQMLNDIDEL